MQNSTVPFLEGDFHDEKTKEKFDTNNHFSGVDDSIDIHSHRK